MNLFFRNKKYAFTLVELIVVIVILAILATIAFLSFNSYNSSARDSVRISDLNQIYRWLVLYQTHAWKFPQPENSIKLFSWTTQIWYQWNVAQNTLKLVNLSSWWWIDPVNSNYYSYNVNLAQNKAQVVWFLENAQSLSYEYADGNFFPQTNAYYKNDFTFTKWDPLCFILFQSWSNNYTPAHDLYSAWTSFYTNSWAYSSWASCVLDNTSNHPKLADVILAWYTWTWGSYVNGSSVALSSLDAPIASATTNITFNSVTWNWNTSSWATRYEFSSDNSNWISLWNILTYNESWLSPSVNISRYVRACNIDWCSTLTALSSTTLLANVYVAKNWTWAALCGTLALPCNTISLWISKASSWQTVFVFSWTYIENVNISNKTIKLYWENKNSTNIKIYAVLSDWADHKAIVINNSPNTIIEWFSLDLTTFVWSGYQLHWIFGVGSANMIIRDISVFSSTSQYIQWWITLSNSSYTSIYNSKLTTAYHAWVWILAQTNTYGMTVKNTEISGPWFNWVTTDSGWGSDWVNFINNYVKWADDWVHLRWNWNLINNTIVWNWYWVTFNYWAGEFKNNIIAYNTNHWMNVWDSSYKITWYNNTFYSNWSTYNSNYISSTGDVTTRDPKFTDSSYKFLSAISSGQASDSPELDSWIWTLAWYWITNNSTSTNWQDDSWTIDRWYHWKQ